MSGFTDAVQGGGVAGTTVVDDNTDASVLIKGSDNLDYLEIDTSDSDPKIILAAGGAKVGIGTTDPGELLELSDGTRKMQFDIGTSGTATEIAAVENDLKLATRTGFKNILFAGTGGEYLRMNHQGKLSTNETTALCAEHGLHLKESDSGVTSVSDKADMLVIETSHPGISLIGTNTDRNTIAFGDPQSNIAGELRYTHGGGSNADMFFLLMQNSVAINVDHDHKLGVNHECGDSSAQLTVKGNLTADLTGTFTATNGSATLSSGSSTAFTTQLEAGSAIEIFESGTSRGVFTVASITSATELVLDSTVSGLSSSPKTGMTGKTDPALFKVQTGDAGTSLIVNQSRVGINKDAPDTALHVHDDDGAIITLSGNANADEVGLSFESNGAQRFASLISTATGITKLRAGSSESGLGHGIQIASGGASVEHIGFALSGTSDTTITLDDSSNSIFKVVDNKGSPATYLKITQDGISQLGTTTGQTKLFGGEVSLMPTGYIIQTQGYSQLNKIVAVDGGATTATLNVRLQFSGPGQAHHVNPSSSAQVFTLSIRDSANVSGEQANTLYAWERMTLQFHNTGSAACTVKATTPNGTLRAVDASGASIGACDGTGFSVAANTTIGFRVSKFNAKHASGTTSTNVVLIETLWTASNS